MWKQFSSFSKIFLWSPIQFGHICYRQRVEIYEPDKTKEYTCNVFLLLLFLCNKGIYPHKVTISWNWVFQCTFSGLSNQKRFLNNRPIQQQAYVFPSLPFAVETEVLSNMLPFMSLARFNFIWALAFLRWWQHGGGSVIAITME